MHASAQPLVLRSSRAHQRTHSKTRPCTRTHDTHAYTQPKKQNVSRLCSLTNISLVTYISIYARIRPNTPLCRASSLIS